MRKIILLVAVLLLAYTIVKAQDAHSSQQNSFQNYYNPALVAATGYKYNAGIQYRSQWANIDSPYRNMGAYYSQQNNGFGFGLSVIQNDAGAASLKTMQAALKGAYQQQLGQNNYISVGAEIGLYQKRFDPDAFTFDSQYIPGQGAGQGIESGESFDQTSLSMIDMGLGILWNAPISFLANTKASVGFALEHINQPRASFNAEEEVKLPMKSNLHFGLESQIMEQVYLLPYFAYAKQGDFKEWSVGTDLAFQVNESTKIIAGFAQRQGDAFILKAGINYNNIMLNLSYDMNTSALQTATNGNGAVELNASIALEEINRSFSRKKSAKRIQEPVKIVTKNGIQDRDEDGIADNLDECPDVPGLIKYNGCRDTDKDGIWDSIDECPNLYGAKSNRGCPSKAIDSDGDGIIDTKDTCPFLKGIQSMGGCPDTDRDGISDIEDYCPYMKGEIANHGCPVSQVKESNFEQLSLIVHFDTDKSNIKTNYITQLYELTQRLKTLEYGSYRILLEGHTDAEGNTDYNFRLGERRATVIKDFLITQGISSTIIETISYGEYQPATDNNTTSHKSLNRRTIVNVMLRN